MRRRDCVRNWDDTTENLDTNSVRQETPADDNEVRILKCHALVRTAGTHLGITRGPHVG